MMLGQFESKWQNIMNFTIEREIKILGENMSHDQDWPVLDIVELNPNPEKRFDNYP